MKITVKTKELKAVSLAMADKDVRYYLNGLAVEVANGTGRIIATDGHRMHAINIGATDSAPGMAIIPRDAITAACKLKTQQIEIETSEKTYTIRAAGQSLSGDLVDSRFPDYRRVIPNPAEFTATAPRYQAAYLSDAEKAWALVTGKHVCDAPPMVHTGGGSGVMGTEALLVVIMPVRETEGYSPSAAAHGVCNSYKR